MPRFGGDATEKFIYKKQKEITALSASFTDFSYKKHCHKEYAFGVTLRGVQQYYLGKTLMSSYPHGVMLFAPGQVHDGRAQGKEGIDYVMLYVDPGVFSAILGKNDVFRFPLPIVYDRQLERSILSLSGAVLQGADEALCSELLLALAQRAAGAGGEAEYRRESGLIRRAKEMIDDNLGSVLRLDAICAELELSKYKLIRAFKAGTGLSPYQYFLNRKVALARQLIEKHRDVYTAVSVCGFVDINHLNRHFKSVYGTTAHEYLQLMEKR